MNLNLKFRKLELYPFELWGRTEPLQHNDSAEEDKRQESFSENKIAVNARGGQDIDGTPPRWQKSVDLYPRRIYNVQKMVINSVNAPLTPAVLHILLALSTEERHGYGIMKQVESDSQGKVKMGPGTLYGSLGRMMEAGLIRESDKKVDRKLDEERRVYYKITALGQAALAAELERYREVVAVAKRKQLAPGAFGYGI